MRLKPFEKYLKKDGLQVWAGYISEFAKYQYYKFKHFKKWERTVKCQHCGVKVPSGIPRLQITGWYGGHLCPKCAIESLESMIEIREGFSKEVKGDIQKFRKILQLFEEIVATEEYKDKMAIAHLCKKLEVRKCQY